MLLLWLFLLLSPLVSSSPLTKDQSVCAKTSCGAGRECVSTDKGQPVCNCVQRCDASEHWVCGSNDRSYRNHCELHREACVTQTKIHVAHRGRCLEEKKRTDVSPIVCFLSDRDWLRNRVIHWIQEEAEPSSLSSNGTSNGSSSARDLLRTYFQVYDNGDSKLDSTEFLRFLEHNDTALNLTHSNSPENSQLVRSLCVDALIELSDENADWKLSLAEFINCLTPTYQPPERQCALEDEVFEDGAETQMECNRCVCACGSWVCTALTCDGEHKEVEENLGGEDEEMTEEEWSRRVAELNALQG